jgi:acyl-homoserine-lactone acylase
LRRPLSPLAFPRYFERSEVLSLRSQHSLALVDGDARVSLEDVVQRKHSTRMLLADRVKADLLAVVRPRVTGQGDDALRRGLELLERWDHTASADSRGAVLFAEWWRTYIEAIGPEAEPFAQPWTVDAPVATPHGLARPDVAADTFAGAVRWMVERFGAIDVAWGDVHRIRRGAVDEPASGCPGQLGCFRVLNFTDDPDGRRSAVGGDGWVLAVELTNPPRAYSVLAYGQSAKSDSRHHADQAAMFARGEMKPVAYLREDVERQAVRRYRPGLE